MGFGSLAGATPSSGFELIEPGKYLVAITDFKFLSNDNGWEGVRFEFTVQAGKFRNRKVWRLFTISNSKNADQHKRGRDELVGMLTAAGHANPASPDSAPIKGLQLGLRIGKTKNKETKDEENSVRSWFPKAEMPAEGDTAVGTAAQTSLSLASLGAASSAGTLAAASTPPADAALSDEIPF